MSHKSARKSHTAALAEEKDKKTDSPLKEMKKKIAANAEREKQATDKNVVSSDRAHKSADKVTEKSQNEKADKKAHTADKDKVPTPDKNAHKHAEKVDKNVEKDKVVDKKVDKPIEKKNEAEKKEEAKADGKDKAEKPKQNGASNGEAHGADTVSDGSSGEELLVIDDQDELFPELTYDVDDNSDADYEEGAPSRSFTRRSQVKATKTPETPRPASVKEDDKDGVKEDLVMKIEKGMLRWFGHVERMDERRLTKQLEQHSKEKLLKMSDSLVTDRKLRSADSPKPESKKTETKKAQDSPKKDESIDLTEDEPEKTVETDKNKEGSEKNKDVNEKNKDVTEKNKDVTEKNKDVNEKNKEGAEKSEGIKKTAGKSQLEMEVVNEQESTEDARRARARVSPYSRPAARLDLTTSSLTANYTGNNTTMEMDITETSMLEEPGLDDSSYLRGLRSIKGRTSYKQLKELSLKHTHNRSTRSNTSVNTSLSEAARPTGTVVGRKRRPDDEEAGPEGGVPADPAPALHAHSKRMRLLDRFSVPFRGFHARQAAEIVGINTDLPLTAPVASTSTFDPETLKTSPSDPLAVPLPPPAQERESKKCIIM